jgi:hypothetical protein
MHFKSHHCGRYFKFHFIVIVPITLHNLLAQTLSRIGNNEIETIFFKVVALSCLLYIPFRSFGFINILHIASFRYILFFIANINDAICTSDCKHLAFGSND